jgi:hypothetical protein
VFVHTRIIGAGSGGAGRRGAGCRVAALRAEQRVDWRAGAKIAAGVASAGFRGFC